MSNPEHPETTNQPSDIYHFAETLKDVPSFKEHIESMAEKPPLRHDRELQAIYNEYCDSPHLSEALERYNKSLPSPLLASGLSGYFNEQVTKNGLNHLGLTQSDTEDAQFISSQFGPKTIYGENGVPILYTTLPGTTEMGYAAQDFPAGIFEDVFRCSVDHSLPLSPKVGESEVDYYERVLRHQIDEKGDIPPDVAEEMILRGRRLTEHFCKGQNRVYFIPITDLMDTKASFGDVMGLRNGSDPNALDDVATLAEMSDYTSGDIYGDPNFSSEYGVALYGDIKSQNVSFIEVERNYDKIQRQARAADMKLGQEISLEKLSEIELLRNELQQRLDTEFYAAAIDPEGLAAAKAEDERENQNMQAAPTTSVQPATSMRHTEEFLRQYEVPFSADDQARLFKPEVLRQLSDKERLLLQHRLNSPHASR